MTFRSVDVLIPGNNITFTVFKFDADFHLLFVADVLVPAEIKFKRSGTRNPVKHNRRAVVSCGDCALRASGGKLIVLRIQGLGCNRPYPWNEVIDRKLAVRRQNRSE